MSTDTAAPPAELDDEPLPGMPDPESTATGAAESTDPEAPYGRRADGEPRGRPGRPRKSASATRPPTAPRPRKRAAGRPAGRPAGPDYRTAILGMMQLPAAGLAMVALQAGPKMGPVLAADAAAISQYAPPIADALAALARENAAVAAVLERVLTVGPYGALIAAVVPLCMQLAANHGVVPAGMLGTVSVPEMLGEEYPAGSG